MPTKQVHKFDIPGSEQDAKFKHQKRIEDGARFDVWIDDSGDDRKWRVDVLDNGDTQLVASYRDDSLADVPQPAWLSEWAASIRRGA
ncbi:hypothetical protein [Halobacterium hubeiense]|uniref:hypothetical protein n=1 Tax=Halobacterium hubeiense TaxID=1407499 RepID=UPI000B7D68D7|nr:hypothetical protein [Halobacterium hubeiense]